MKILCLIPPAYRAMRVFCRRGKRLADPKYDETLRSEEVHSVFRMRSRNTTISQRLVLFINVPPHVPRYLSEREKVISGLKMRGAEIICGFGERLQRFIFGRRPICLFRFILIPKATAAAAGSHLSAKISPSPRLVRREV